MNGEKPWSVISPVEWTGRGGCGRRSDPGFGLCLLDAFQRRARDGLPGAAADHAVVDDRARLPEWRVVVGELQVAALARVERGPAVVELLLAVDPGPHEAVR